jgi:hypothetical protein
MMEDSKTPSHMWKDMSAGEHGYKGPGDFLHHMARDIFMTPREYGNLFTGAYRTFYGGDLEPLPNADAAH